MSPSQSATPVKLAHVVLRTRNYDALLAWWKLVLNAEVRHGNDFITFLSFDEEHHRIAIVKMPHLQDQAKDSVGVEHFAFTFADLDALFAKYEQLKAEGITPYWTINHGMTLSAYYRDPDGNQVETAGRLDVDGAGGCLHERRPVRSQPDRHRRRLRPAGRPSPCRHTGRRDP